MNNHFKKGLASLIFSCVITVVTGSNVALASSGGSSSSGMGQVVGVLKASKYTQMQEDYQKIPGFANIKNRLTSLVSAVNGSNSGASGFSNTNSIKCLLQYFHQQFVPINPLFAISYVLKCNASILANPISFGAIYISPKTDNPSLTSNMFAMMTDPAALAGIPKLFNKKFEAIMTENLKGINFATLLNPDSFNTKQAKQFIANVIDDNNFKSSLISGELEKKLKDFRDKINLFISKKKAKDKLKVYSALIELMDKDSFKNYLAKVKSIISSRSIIQGYFNRLASENVSQGGKPSMAKAMKDMAMQPLSATNLQSIQTSSPAAVQRMLLIAQLRNNFLLYQLHQDMTMQSGLLALQGISNINTRLTTMLKEQNALKSDVGKISDAIK